MNATYQVFEDYIDVSIKSLNNKLNRLITTTSAELVRYAPGQATPIIEKLDGMLKPYFIALAS